ncbi:MAG: SUMF1/EgtB/PvdO family nonheme iron enzyme [Patescibacteria group bacterium]
MSSLPTDPLNTTSTGNYYTYVTGGSWKLKAQFESSKNTATAAKDGGPSTTSYELGSNLTLGPITFPDNWIKVPGNSSFGTNDFWVMKYEAKCVDAATNTPLTTPDTGYNTYSNSTTACTGARYPASAADGYPIANISHDTAKTYCQNIGAHLLTNDEWMTIARNAEQVNSNWSTSVGNGYLYSGHNDNVPALALIADKDDANGYSGTGNTTGSNQKRTLTLSNGSVIWDIPGNVWEHVQRSVNNVGDLTTIMSLPACSDAVAGWGWCQYGNSTTPYVSSWTSDAAQSKVGPSNTSWNSTQGMGQVYTYKNGTSQSTTVFLRGGHWSYGSIAGVFALRLIWVTGTTDGYVGFRCARN